MNIETITPAEREYMRRCGERMRMRREAAGLTQADVYVRTSIHSNTVSNYENGERGASIIRLRRLAKLYGCNICDFLEDRT